MGSRERAEAQSAKGSCRRWTGLGPASELEPAVSSTKRFLPIYPFLYFVTGFIRGFTPGWEHPSYQSYSAHVPKTCLIFYWISRNFVFWSSSSDFIVHTHIHTSTHTPFLLLWWDLEAYSVTVVSRGFSFLEARALWIPKGPEMPGKRSGRIWGALEPGMYMGYHQDSILETELTADVRASTEKAEVL